MSKYIYIHIKMLFPSETDGTISRSSAGHHLSYPNYIEADYREDQVCWISPQTKIMLAPKLDEMTDGLLLLLSFYKLAVTVFGILCINLKWKSATPNNKSFPAYDLGYAPI